MEWMFDPTAWTGLVALAFLELVLGIDNLVFIAILAQRLPPKQRDLACQSGLLLALGMRIAMLLAISWMATLTQPLFAVFEKTFSGRDLLMLGGGAFLLWKATVEIHSRLEGRSHGKAKAGFQAKFWMVVTQIFVLDTVFSIDAIVTAIGMTEHLMIMVLAMTIAIIIMILVSKPLTAFLQKHPTVVMLCLGFLLMVGFSLVAEGFGAVIPKGYLYAAIGFSLLIETINQFAQARLKSRVRNVTDVRQKTADAILKLMGAKPMEGAEEMQEANAVLLEATQTGILTATEKEMLRGVLNLSMRPIQSVMTPRRDLQFVNIRALPKEIFAAVEDADRTQLLAIGGEADNVVGILRKDEFLSEWLRHGESLQIEPLLREPLFVKDTFSVISLLELFKKNPVGMAVVTDDTGSVEGVVTHIDLLEAVAGEFPSQDEPYTSSMRESADGSVIVDGLTSIYDVCHKLGVDDTLDGRFTTIGGLVLHQLGRMPAKGDKMDWHGWRLEVRRMEGRRVAEVALKKPAESAV